MNNLLIKNSETISSALKKFTKVGENTLIVVNNNLSYLGTITSGDIRRQLLKKKKLSSKIKDIYNQNSTFYYSDNFHKYENQISKLFSKKKFEFIPIINKKKKIIKIISLRDFLKNKKIIKTSKKKILNKSLKNISAVIMAGGLGTRMTPFTEVLPKPLIPIKGKPVINKIIENFLSHGLKNLWVTINFKGQLLKSYLNETKYKKNIRYYHENKPLGTVGSLQFFHNKLSKTFILTNCDTIISTDYSKIIDFHKKNNFDITIVASLKKIDIPYGVCRKDKKNNFVNLEEKPNIRILVNSGMYVVNKEMVKLIPLKKYDMNELISKLKSAQKKIGLYNVSSNSWIDVGNWEEYYKSINS